MAGLCTLLGLVAVPSSRVIGAIAPFADFRAPLSTAMSLATCAGYAFAFSRAVGDPPGRPNGMFGPGAGAGACFWEV